MITNKQAEYIKNATKRWNVKVGGTGTGKTYIDQHYTIAKRTKQFAGREGIYLLIGVTTSTIERNVLAPMREVFGDGLVGNIIKGESTVQLFGETYYVIGAEKENAVNKIQGATVKYIYGDEFVDWNESFFNMLTTRMRVEGATADLTGNPKHPNHWAKLFIDKMVEDGTMFYQHSTIYDNPTLPKEFVESQLVELAGTTEFNRLILGQWASAEGAIYKGFDDRNIISHEEYAKIKDQVLYVQIGVDFGGNKSKTAFQATAILKGFDIITIKERRFEEEKDINYINTEFEKFITDIYDQGYNVRVIRMDNADSVAIRSMKTYAQQSGHVDPNLMRNARKGAILDRVRTYQRMINSKRYKVLEDCVITTSAFQNAVWSDKVDKDGKEKRLDDGTMNIDTLDAQEYSTEELHNVLLKVK